MTSEENMALIYLVRRETQCDTVAWWYGISADINMKAQFQCGLCGEDFYKISLLEEHGINHLKERNLLPFI